MTKIEKLQKKLDFFNADLKPYNDIIQYVSKLVSSITESITTTQKELDAAIAKQLDKKLYKWVTTSGKAAYAGNQFQYSLPSNGKPGKWHTTHCKLVFCHRGFHYLKRKDITSWTAARLFEVEVRGNLAYGTNKGVARSLRLVREISKSSNEYKTLIGIK